MQLLGELQLCRATLEGVNSDLSHRKRQQPPAQHSGHRCFPSGLKPKLRYPEQRGSEEQADRMGQAVSSLPTTATQSK